MTGRSGPSHPESTPKGAARLARRLGVVLSAALVGGLVWWGYGLVMRDVTGVPVLRALEGPARIAPEDPGGRLARHTGLAVNEVAANGVAEPAPDRVMLAPGPVELAEEDGAMTGVAPPRLGDPGRPAPADTPASGAPASPLGVPRVLPQPDLPGGTARPAAPPTDETRAEASADASAGAEVDDAPADAAADAAPAVPLDPAAAATLALAEDLAQRADDAAASDVVPPDVPGLARSPRPVAKPANEDLIALAAARAVAEALAPAPEIEIAPEDIPAGTRLAQLGAFDSAEIARAEWDRLAGRFGALMAGKRRVVQAAESGGRKFFRLRVEGFADLDEARSFCAALVAEGQNCIPTLAH